MLKVADVMRRYGMRDERTARRLMNEAGGFKVGGRLVVREDSLGRWEARQVSPNPRPVTQSGVKANSGRRATQPTTPTPVSGPDWWRPEAAGDFVDDCPR